MRDGILSVLSNMNSLQYSTLSEALVAARNVQNIHAGAHESFFARVVVDINRMLQQAFRYPARWCRMHERSARAKRASVSGKNYATACLSVA